jgi:tRNA pseudouridine55 synthase
MGRRRSGDAVSGVLLLAKPAGLTSNFALQAARRLLGAAKAGHAGTLDPLATGLLPLLYGEATKFSADLLEADKAYDALLKLGVRTSTADAEGEVLETRPVAVTRAQLESVLPRFTGALEQVPPMHSALKRDGRPLYEYARAGIEVERAARPVVITALELLEFDGERVRLRIACSKGTYVRTLAEDIGAALGCGAHLAALVRTRVGPLRLTEAVTLPQLEAATIEARRVWLMPVDALLASLPRVELAEATARRFAHGGEIDLGGAPGRKRVYGPGERLLGTAELDAAGVLRPRRLISMAAAVTS